MEKVIDTPGRAEEHGGHQEKAAHCMRSLCCFHETFVFAQLAATGLLLPSSRLIERGAALSSHSGAAEDRPPRHI